MLTLVGALIAGIILARLVTDIVDRWDDGDDDE